MSAIVVVSDTSPIRALHHLGHLALLHDLYGRVLIPAAVQHELLKAKPAIDATSLAFLEVRKPLSAAVPSAAIGLDPGETEAILLAQEIGATLLLIDERAGTRVARAMGIDTVGVLGVLLEAKKAGRIPRALPLVDELIRGLGFHVSNAVRQHFAALASE